MGIVTVLTEGSEGFDGWTVVVEVVAPVETMTRRKVGKVLTPLKVFSARLPLRFGQFYAGQPAR